MGQTVVEKISQAHMVEGPRGRPLRVGDFLSIRPRHVLTHDNTAPVIEKFRALGAPRIRDPRQPVFVLDHDIQNTTESNLKKYRAIEAFAREQGVDFYPAGSGIGHQVIVEQLYVVPGSFVVASDSHANMYGAMGAIGTPVVRTDAAAIWATETFWWQIPRSVRVVLEGQLESGATGKDVILALCGLYTQGEVLNAAVEFDGPGAATLSLEERLTIANMTTEWGALVGWFPADRATSSYLEARRDLLAGRGVHRVADEELRSWTARPLRPDSDAVYAGTIRLDLSQVTPHVSGPDTVQVATPLGEIESRNIRIHKAYLVSCVNSRAEDLAAAARVLRGKKISSGVEFYVSAASREVEEQASREGSWQALVEAGARRLPPGCGPCIGLGAGLLAPGEVGISATNRNFKGRMGSRDAQCYLASPAVVASSALAGRIVGPCPSRNARLAPCFEPGAPLPADDRPTEILPGFPARIIGRLVFLTRDNLDTDGIYGKDHTYRDGRTPEQMAEVLFENYDPALAGRLRRGDLLLGGFNFGSGSSREQAVTALQAAGIALVIAGSFSRTYLRNAFNNGFPCVECAELVIRVRRLMQLAVGQASLVTGDEVEIDFSSSALTFRGERFRFPALGTVPQSLVVAGGVENQVRERLGLSGGPGGR